eukprot:1619919-Karenia_brevis.AAC.1
MVRSRRRRRDQESTSDSSSESSIGVRSHSDPSVVARRQRLGMEDNKFDREEEDEEEPHERESSSSTFVPAMASGSAKEEVKE